MVGAVLNKVEPASSMFLMCDVQERFREVIYKFSAVALGARRMARGAGVLGVPLIVTEQYPKVRCVHAHVARPPLTLRPVAPGSGPHGGGD